MRRLALPISVIAFFLGSVSLTRGANAGTLTGQVQVRDGAQMKSAGAGVVVYLNSSPSLDGKSKGKALTKRIVQKDHRFVPALTVVAKGGTVGFPNDDRVFHNVFSLSSAKRFDLGLFRDGESRSVTFKKLGVIDVYCNIHPQMTARIKVVPNSFHAITDSKGRFSIKNVPKGRYTIVAWNGNETSKPVEISRSRSHKVSLELAPAPQRKRHTRKDRTPYRRYR